MTLTFECLTYLHDDEKAAIQKIYEENFPAEEKIDFNIIAGSIHNERYLLHVVRCAGDLAGFSWTSRMGATAHYFIHYLAVTSHLQGQGIGQQLLRLLIASLREQGRAETLLWEVEPPHSDENHANNRRIRFYERCGAFLVKYSTSYAMPDMTDPEHKIFPLRLMFVPLSPVMPPNDRTNARIWMDTILSNVYAKYPHVREKVLGNRLV